jgi:fructose-bisphosphate aldolase class 1
MRYRPRLTPTEGILGHFRCFPTAMKTANFLSGGQSLSDAAGRLNAMNKLKTAKDPWNLSFSWSAALQVRAFYIRRLGGSSASRC